MARQTALRRVQDAITKAQDEDSTPLVDGNSLVSVPQSTRSLEGSNDSSSGHSPISNHGSNGAQDGITDVVNSKIVSPHSAYAAGTTNLQEQYKTKLSGVSSSNSSSKRRTSPKCGRCNNHDLKITLKGHKRYCKFRDCICPRCQLTVIRQKVTAKQTALKRALAQDEKKVRAPEEVDPVPFTMDTDHLITTQVQLSGMKPEASYDSNSGNSPISNHGSNNAVVSIPSTRKLPPVQPHTALPIHLPQAQPGDNVEVLLEWSIKLLKCFQFPWHMMPLMYVIVKDTGANLEAAARRIIEAHEDIRTLPFWNMLPMVQNANMMSCCPGYAPSGIMGAPTYEGQAPYIGISSQFATNHLRPPSHPLNAHVPTADCSPEHSVAMDES